MRRLALVVLLLLLPGCENAEEKARYVKAPLDGVEVTNRAQLDSAVSEARTRLVSVRDDQLREDLAREIDAVYERAMAEAREVERKEVERKEAERKAAELEKERQAAREREAQAREAQRKLESERRKRVRETEPDLDQDARRDAALAAQRRRAKDAATNLEVTVRPSALGDGTKVLVMRNAKDYPVDFNLRCRNDLNDKTFPITVPAHGEKHFGFVQGWCGNFRGGERCEAYVDGERMWKYTIP